MSYSNYEKLLELKKSTSYKVAKATGIAHSTLSDWKNGRSVPKADKLKLIADYFGVEMSCLVGNCFEDGCFSFAENEMQKGSYDVVFTDLWHDVGDGLPLYRRMRSYEDRLPQSRFLYWIEKTMRCYEKEML